jgi:hypothetical protein
MNIARRNRHIYLSSTNEGKDGENNVCIPLEYMFLLVRYEFLQYLRRILSYGYITVRLYIPEVKSLRLSTHVSWRLLGHDTRVWGNIGWYYLLLWYLLKSSGLHAFNIVCVVADESRYAATPDLVHLFCNNQGQMKMALVPTFTPSLMITGWNSYAVICATLLYSLYLQLGILYNALMSVKH